MSASNWVEQEIILPEYEESWLDKYKEKFDLDTIDWKLTTYQDWTYGYVIYGNKKGNYAEHRITIYCADGLVGHTDDFVFEDVEFFGGN